MAYGVMIATTKGMSDLSDITTMRETYRIRRTSSADGEVALPAGIAVASAIPWVVTADGGTDPYVTISPTNNRLYWQDSGSSDFTIFIYRFD